MTVTFDSSILLSYYQSRAGVPVTGLGATGTAQKKVAPTAPWTGAQDAAAASAAVKAALIGRKLIDENGAKLDLAGASADYKKMFALYQGLGTLSGVAEQINAKGLTSFDKARIQSTFAKGMAEIGDYVSSLQLDQLRLKQGDVSTQARAALGVPKTQPTYVTPPLLTGSSSGEVPAFTGNVQFNISVKRINTISNVAIDLSQMGASPRTMSNVISFINTKLADAGAYTRVASQRIPGAARTTEIGGKTVTLAPAPDQWAMAIKADSSETLTFSAPATAPAVYVAQSVGDPDPDKKASTDDDASIRQLLKFQTDSSTVAAPTQTAGQANWVDGRVFSQDLDKAVQTVRATQVGPDGSVYMLADIDGKIGAQGIKGDSDVALLKYDSAGKLIYTRTLGASDQASGMALAVSATGQVAIAGSVKGGLNGAVEGALNSGATGTYADYTDSFVTTFDADGQELWTQRRGARQNDEATDLTFGADGTVYVAGRAKSALPATTPVGDWDNYIEAFKVDAKGVPKPVFTQAFGTAAADRPAGMVLDGTSLVVAAVENGRGVLRRFDISSGTPVLSNTRDLGDLQGGDITGLALDGGDIVVAGSTANTALNAGTITNAHAGGADAFAARLSASLTPSGSDQLAYYGGTGDDRATALAVSGGKVWITGSAGTDLPGQAPVGKKDGFLAQLDIATGTVAYSKRFTGKDGFAAPTSLAVDPTGASALDRLGLPKGAVDLTDSLQITAATSLRAGEQFTVRANEGRTTTITIDRTETLDTLAQKIRRATGFQVKITIASSEGKRKLTIAPLNARTIIEFGAGKTDKNALEMLGIPEGIVRTTVVTKGVTGLLPADGKGQIYGLGLPSNLNLNDTNEVAHAIAEIAAAQGVIRKAYKDLVAAASPRTAEDVAKTAAATGTVPQYLKDQIANYQAALTRLGG